MKSLLKVLPFALVLSCLCSCTHSVHLVNFSEDVPLLKKSVAKPIEAHAQQFVILGFVTQTDYVNQAYHQLQSQCPNGTIGAIATKYYTDHGFFSWTNNIVMDGRCYN